MLIQITDKHELQNLLDDFSPSRPRLNIYDSDLAIYANEAEMQEWRSNQKRFISRDALRSIERAAREVVRNSHTYLRDYGRPLFVVDEDDMNALRTALLQKEQENV